MDFYASGEEVCLPVESDKEQDIGVFGYRFLPPSRERGTQGVGVITSVNLSTIIDNSRVI